MLPVPYLLELALDLVDPNGAVVPEITDRWAVL